MAMRRCEAGLHFYNPDKSSVCPYCKYIEDDHERQAVKDDLLNIRDRSDTTDEIGAAAGVKPTIKDAKSEVEVVTRGVFSRKAGLEPVVGWLVCVKGAEIGKDYPLREGINEVGRDSVTQILIKGDDMISRRDHAEIEYDPDENVFYLIRKKNQAVKLNGVKIRQPLTLKPYDIVQFGETIFVFIPLCNETFKWSLYI